jgi:hypothetical protein
MNPGHHEDLVEVTVKYAAAEDLLKNSAVPVTETIGSFRARVLDAFELADGAVAGGSSVIYVLFHDRQPIENMNLTVGQLAGEGKHLHLKLAQQVIQG